MSSIHFFLDNGNPIHIMRRVPQSKTDKSPYRVQVLDRALAALEVLANSSTECSLAEICSTLKLHKSTTHRLMMVLEQHRLVEKNVDTGRYRLGLKLYWIQGIWRDRFAPPRQTLLGPLAARD